MGRGVSADKLWVFVLDYNRLYTVQANADWHTPPPVHKQIPFVVTSYLVTLLTVSSFSQRGNQQNVTQLNIKKPTKTVKCTEEIFLEYHP